MLEVDRGVAWDSGDPFLLLLLPTSGWVPSDIPQPSQHCNTSSGSCGVGPTFSCVPSWSLQSWTLAAFHWATPFTYMDSSERGDGISQNKTCSQSQVCCWWSVEHSVFIKPYYVLSTMFGSRRLPEEQGTPHSPVVARRPVYTHTQRWWEHWVISCGVALRSGEGVPGRVLAVRKSFLEEVCKSRERKSPGKVTLKTEISQRGK